MDALEKNVAKINLLGNVGIGHVRWATHGIPSTVNAHPHSSEKVSVVHNGIIENSTALKKFLVEKGYKFKSQTDTEVITFLLTDFLKEFDLVETINKTLKTLNGSFALGILFKKYNNIVVGARRGSPLAVGYGPEENYLLIMRSETPHITDVFINTQDKHNLESNLSFLCIYLLYLFFTKSSFDYLLITQAIFIKLKNPFFSRKINSFFRIDRDINTVLISSHALII